jgi:hypothetical protein
MSTEKKLTAKQLTGVASLLASPSRDEAAKQTGVSVRTLKRWEELPQFRAALQEGRRALFRAAVDRILSGMGRAFDAIERNLQCGSPGAELRAATILVDAALRWNESDVGEQLDEIKEAVEVLKNAQQ